jgi:hypothetical protein
VRVHRVEVQNFRRHEHLVVDLCDPAGPRPLTLIEDLRAALEATPVTWRVFEG